MTAADADEPLLISRRTLTRGAAWGVPVVALAIAAPRASASVEPLVITPNEAARPFVDGDYLDIVGTILRGGAAVPGTVMTFTLVTGFAIVPAGATYVVRGSLGTVGLFEYIGITAAFGATTDIVILASAEDADPVTFTFLFDADPALSVDTLGNSVDAPTAFGSASTVSISGAVNGPGSDGDPQVTFIADAADVTLPEDSLNVADDGSFTSEPITITGAADQFSIVTKVQGALPVTYYFSKLWIDASQFTQDRPFGYGPGKTGFHLQVSGLADDESAVVTFTVDPAGAAAVPATVTTLDGGALDTGDFVVADGVQSFSIVATTPGAAPTTLYFALDSGGGKTP